jgi:site-specific DNA-methyltransferase (adenine-specific)
MIEYTNEDCMVGMARYPDKYFDLAIVDPPYGIGIVEQFKKTVKSSTSMFNLSNGIVGSEWDGNIPDESYFDELFRVSKNQIVWGGNYFIDYLHNTRSMVVWDKMNGTNPMADAEIAWTSFDTSVRMFRMHHFSKGYGEKTHPTQKPVALYKWLLKNYAKEGDLILDTHVGSASSLIACYDMGFDAVGFELDTDYYKASKQRLEDFMAQPRLEELMQPAPEQIGLEDDPN